MSDDIKVINLADRIAKMREKRLLSNEPDESLPDPVYIDDITQDEVRSFIRVMSFIRQHSSDGTGRIDFDEFQSRITLDFGHRQIYEDDHEPCMKVVSQVELIFPHLYTSLTEEEATYEDEPTLDDITLIAHDVLQQLHMCDEDDT